MNRRASVLMAVLIFIAFMLSLAVMIFDKSSTSYTGVADIQADYQGAVYAGTALKMIETLMGLEDAEYDAEDDVWMTIPDIPVQGGFVMVTIRPADDRLPVNALANTNKDTAKRVQEAFDFLFAEKAYDSEVWRSMHDWVNGSGGQMLSTSVENAEFNTQHNSFTAKHSPLETLAEIRLLPSVSGMYKELSGLVCMGETEPRININFASSLTIKALLPELGSSAEQIVEFRQEQPFKKKDDLYMFLGSGNVSAYTAVLPFFDVKSTLFYVKIEVNILETQKYYHALYRRSGKSMTLLRYIEGRNIDYF